MELSEELTKLQELHDTGVLTDEEFARAKANVLSAGASPVDPTEYAQMERAVKDLRFQGEIARIDREWKVERIRYMKRGENGLYYKPTYNSAIGSLFTAFLAGLATIPLSHFAPPDRYFYLFAFGLAALIFAICGLGEMIKTGKYEKAYRRYLNRRADLTKMNEEHALPHKENSPV